MGGLIPAYWAGRGDKGFVSPARVCSGCGVELPVMPHQGNPRKWCSEVCRQRTKRASGEYKYPHYRRSHVWIRDCSECGRVYVARGPRGLACPACASARQARLGREKYAEDPESWKAAVTEWRKANPERKLEAQRRYRERVGRLDCARAADHRRRAAKAGAESEQFNPGEIYERDGWRCGICGKRIRQDLKYPHPKSVSLDHIVPISQGGPHTRANTRATHRHCNVARNNRGGGEQLALLG